MAAMNMQTVRALMKEAKTGFLATTDGQRAEVRCMGAWAWVDKELWLATSAVTQKVADVQARPRVEICFMAPDGRNVRIGGYCRVSRDPQDKNRLYRMVPMLDKYMAGPENPNYVVLRITPDRVRLMVTLDLKVVAVDPDS